jgi:hypothetical protein
MVTYSELFEFAMVLMTFANLGIQIVGLIVQVHIAKEVIAELSKVNDHFIVNR